MSFTMTTASLPLLLSGLLLHPLRALAYLPELPIQTTTSDQAVAIQSWSPRPTENPALLPQHIFARQNNPFFPQFSGDAGVVLVAPDNTCGYIGGRQGAPYSCGTEQKCIFFSATSSSYGLAACCTSGVSCRIRSTCIESAQYSTACDGACAIDLFTLKCTASEKPFCGQIEFASPSIRDYWCLAAKPTGVFNATTEFAGATRKYSTIAKSALWPVASSSSSSRAVTGTTTSEEDSSPTSDESQIKPTPSDAPKKSSSVGIIAGVVGGIVGAALLGIGGFFLWKKRRSQRAGAPALEPYTAYNTQADTQGHQQYPMNPVSAYAQTQYDPYKQSHQDAGGPYAAGHQQYYDPQKPQQVQELQGRQDPQELYSQPARGQQYSELPAGEVRTGNENDPGSPFRDSARL